MVDFPEPFSPINEILSPVFTSKFTPFSTFFSPKFFFTLFNSISIIFISPYFNS